MVTGELCGGSIGCLCRRGVLFACRILHLNFLFPGDWLNLWSSCGDWDFGIHSVNWNGNLRFNFNSLDFGFLFLICPW